MIRHPYFECAQPMVWDDDSTYVQADQVLTATVTHEWNHGLGEIVSALLRHGLDVTGLEEHDSVPWEALPGQMEFDKHGEWRLRSEGLAPATELHTTGGQSRFTVPE